MTFVLLCLCALVMGGSGGCVGPLLVYAVWDRSWRLLLGALFAAVVCAVAAFALLVLAVPYLSALP